jgi:hypothetical protein
MQRSLLARYLRSVEILLWKSGKVVNSQSHLREHARPGRRAQYERVVKVPNAGHRQAMTSCRPDHRSG